jgi:pimeloyl-ACP methyl ester carboxylesterase
MGRRRVWLGAAVLGGLLLLGAGADRALVPWLAHAIVDTPNQRRTSLGPDPDVEELARIGVDHEFRVPVGPPAASLSVWVLDPPTSLATPRGTVLVLHGMRDRKLTMLDLGRLLSRNGFRAVLVDLRGHGQSTGDWLTYGIVEARDLVTSIDDLEKRRLLSNGLGVYGPSYGGGVALQLAAIDTRVQAVVVISTFSSGLEAVTDHVRRIAPRWLVPQVRIDQAVRKADQLANVRLEDARSSTAIAATRAACLILHGGTDTVLPPRHARTLAAAAANHAQLIVIDGEGHDTIFRDRSGTISRETLAWFRRWLAVPGRAS